MFILLKCTINDIFIRIKVFLGTEIIAFIYLSALFYCWKLIIKRSNCPLELLSKYKWTKKGLYLKIAFDFYKHFLQTGRCSREHLECIVFLQIILL